jgi:hypothetical protein
MLRKQGNNVARTGKKMLRKQGNNVAKTGKRCC